MISSDKRSLACVDGAAQRCLRCRLAQRHMPLNGGKIVLLRSVEEDSTAKAFDLVTRLVINPGDPRHAKSSGKHTLARRVPRSGDATARADRAVSLSENRTLGVHLPMKIGELFSTLHHRSSRKCLAGIIDEKSRDSTLLTAA